MSLTLSYKFEHSPGDIVQIRQDIYNSSHGNTLQYFIMEAIISCNLAGNKEASYVVRAIEMHKTNLTTLNRIYEEELCTEKEARLIRKIIADKKE